MPDRQFAERFVKAMENMRRWPAAALLFLVVCAGIAFVIDAETRQAQPGAGASERAPPMRADRAAPTFTMPPFARFAEVVTRPLFSPTRRPAVTPFREGQRADFRVVGIVISPQDRQALLAHGQPPEVDRVTEGQTLDGWTVKAIRDDRVTLTRAEHEIELKPSYEAGPPQLQSPSQTLPSPPVGPILKPNCGGLPMEACS